MALSECVSTEGAAECYMPLVTWTSEQLSFDMLLITKPRARPVSGHA